MPLSRCLPLLIMASALTCPHARAAVLLFTELSNQPLPLTVQAVGFQFSPGPSGGSAVYGSDIGLGALTYVQDEVLTGPSDGTLTITFLDPITTLRFGVALLSGDSLTPGFHVDLFSDVLQVASGDVNTDPLVSFSEGEFSFSGSSFD